MKILLAGLLALSFPGVVCGEDPPGRRTSGHSWTSAPPAREEMASLEARLEGAVSRVSVPHAGVLLGRSSSSRGYRLPGYGVVFVLTPRALPGEGDVFVMRSPHGSGHPGGGVVRVERHVTEGGPGWDAHHVEELERQVLVLQHTAEAQRRAAEEDRDRLVRDVRVRLEVHRSGPEGEEPDVTAETRDDPPPPDAYWVTEPGETAPPPWRFWFEAEAGEEERTPDKVVSEVRAALLEALDSEGNTLDGLAPEEYVTVAVDFVPGGFFTSRRRPTRTLIVRARQRDLAARARGTLGSEELRARVEVIEY